MKTTYIASFVRIGLVSLGPFLALPLTAQTAARNQAGGVNTLPPALRAAVASGNQQAIRQAIITLSAGNSVRLADLANQVVTEAERMLSSNPMAAVAIAGAAIDAVNSNVVQNAAPTQAMAVVTTASRIMIDPAAQRVAPQQVAALAVNAAQIVANPVVYQTAPQAAVSVLANSYAAVTSQIVAAAAPTASTAVTQTINTASTNPALSSSASQITALLTSRPVNNAQTTTTQTIPQIIPLLSEEDSLRFNVSPSS